MRGVVENADYQLRVAAEEIELMREEIWLGNLPHIKAILGRPGTRWMLARLQELIWSLERVFAKTSSLSATLVGPVAGRPAASAAPYMWFDVTSSYRSGFKGGIARSAMKLAAAATRNGEALPVVMRDGEIYSYFDAEGTALRIDENTIFVILDTFWKPFDEYVSTLDLVHARGGRAILCVHDVIALDYPIFFDLGFTRAFHFRLETILRRVDACVTQSKYTLAQLRAHFDESATRTAATFRPGADIGKPSPDGSDDVRPAIRTLFDGNKAFISVGTVEPRKGYPVTLDAFDILWANGANCILVIFGQPGWISKSLEKRILEHPQEQRRLFWFKDASDEDISFAYRRAYCLIQASLVEGFGLPIVEARSEGTPVIASNAEIFHEVGQDSLVYFKNGDSVDLARVIQDVLHERPVCEPLDVATWDQSLREFVAAVRLVAPPRGISSDPFVRSELRP